MLQVRSQGSRPLLGTLSCGDTASQPSQSGGRAQLPQTSESPQPLRVRYMVGVRLNMGWGARQWPGVVELCRVVEELMRLSLSGAVPGGYCP